MIFRLNQNNTTLVLKEATQEEYNQLKRTFNPFVKNYRFQKRYKLGIWDGKVDFFKNGFINFGLWNSVADICKEYGYPFKIENKEQFPIDSTINREKVLEFCKDFYKDRRLPDKKDPQGNVTEPGKSFFPHDHQLEAIYKLLKYKFGLVEIATSGGKTLVLSSVIYYILKNINPDAKFLIILPSILLVNQFYDELMDYNEGFNHENENPLDLKITEIMSDRPRKVRDGQTPNIYLGTYQSLEKYPKEFFQVFDFVAVDESHKAKSASITSILGKTLGFAKYRIGVSGTFPDKETAERYHIESLTGPVLYDIRAKKLQDKGLISKVKIKAIQLIYQDDNFGELVYNIRKRGGGKKAYDLERDYIHNSDERVKFIAKLVSKFNNNSLVLFHSIEYGTKIYNYLRDNVPNMNFYYIDGTISAEKRTYIKKQLEDTSNKVNILIASYGTLAVGVSIKALTNVVFTDSFKSPQLITQSIGRILRLHIDKEKAIVFDLVDRFSKKYANTLYNHYLERKKDVYIKQEFPLDELNIVI